jgi:flagellin
MAVGSSGSFSSLSLNFSKNIDKAQKNLSDSFQKLSSGLRINKASDDAAGLAVAAALDSSIVSLGQASRNVSDIASLTAIADGALSQISDLTARKAELATQASNGVYDDSQRANIAAEDAALSQEITRIVETTEFNGIKVFQGASVTGQVGTDASADSQLNVGGLNISQIISGITSTDLTTQAGAQAALTTVQNFSDTLSQSRGEIGATQSRLSSVSNSIQGQRLAESEAVSRIRDADIAEEFSNKLKSEILLQTGTSLAAQAGKLSASNVKALLG